VWENWIVFPQTYLDNLSAILTRRDPEPTSNSSATETPSEKQSVSDGASTMKAAGVSSGFVPVTDGSALGARAEEDLDGEPLDDLDGEPMEDEDSDGEPYVDEDVDGVPMDDEDVDGEPMEDDS